MAGETLLTFAEMLAALPDNSAQLIAPVNMRDVVIANANDIAFLSDSDPFTLPITAGVPVSVLGALPTPDLITNRYVLDGNQQLVADWGAVTVNPGTTRILRLQAQMWGNKEGTQTDTYEFSITVGGTQAGRTVNVELGVQPIGIGLTVDVLYDHSLALPIDLTVTGIGTGDDLNIEDFSFAAIGILI